MILFHFIRSHLPSEPKRTEQILGESSEKRRMQCNIALKWSRSTVNKRGKEQIQWTRCVYQSIRISLKCVISAHAYK